MYQYQITVSKEGFFVFRTEWMQDEMQANSVAKTLKVGLVDHKVIMRRRSNVIESWEV